MNITERVIDSHEQEGVILEYVNFTKKFAEIKEYVRNKGQSIMGYTMQKECVPVRIEDVLYLEAVDGRVFAYTADDNNSELIPYAGGTKQELTDYANRITVHEYGHTIQSLMLGPLMLIPGIISIVWGSMKKYEKLRNEYGVPYTFCWVESWASRLGEKYTGEKAIWR